MKRGIWIRALGLVALLLVNYPTSATGEAVNCWECASCKEGTCCPESVFGHPDCTPNDNGTCNIAPGSCPPRME